MSNKVPQIRFNGYSDAWEERKLEDIFLYKQGQQVPVENQFTKPGKHRHRFIRIVDLTTTDEEPRYIEYSGHNTISATDLFMIRYGQPGVIGYGYEGVIANNLFKLIPKVKANNRFFKYRLDSMYPKIQSLSSSTTMPAISFKSLDVLDVRYPDIKEQEKIGAFFKQLDDTIALHQRKLDLLKEQKKGYLQKMFPRNGAKVPELRFAGFADDWEESKLGEVFDTITDYVANGSFESLRKNVHSSDINGFAYLVRLQDASNNWQGPWLYTDQHGYEFLKKSKLQPDDIIMANVGSVGKFFLVPKLDKPMTLAPNAVLIKSSENDQGFLYQMMLTPEMQYKIFEKTTPGAQSKINKTDFKMIETRLPNIEEQQKIGSFFKQLDNTIALHQRKLDLLKEQKKGFLQKMFV